MGKHKAAITRLLEEGLLGVCNPDAIPVDVIEEHGKRVSVYVPTELVLEVLDIMEQANYRCELGDATGGTMVFCLKDG